MCVLLLVQEVGLSPVELRYGIGRECLTLKGLMHRKCVSHSYEIEEGASYTLPRTVLGGQAPSPGDSTPFGSLALGSRSSDNPMVYSFPGAIPTQCHVLSDQNNR